MGFEEKLRRLNGGCDDDGEGAEAEVHYGAMFFGELMDGVVGERADQVEVSDEGPWLRPRRQIELSTAAGEEEEGESGNGDP